MFEINDFKVLLDELRLILEKMTEGLDPLREKSSELDCAKDLLWRSRRINDKQLKVLTVTKAIDTATCLKWTLTNIYIMNCENSTESKRIKDIEKRAADAARAWELLTKCVYVEYSGYALLDEENACYECLSKYATFLFENKLYDRDTAFWLFSNLPVKDSKPLLYEDLMRAVYNYCNCFAGY